MAKLASVNVGGDKFAVGSKVSINVGRGRFYGKIVKLKEEDGQSWAQVERENPEGRFKKSQLCVWRKVEQVFRA